MPRTAIITDTDSSLPLDIASKYDIRQVPITILFGSDSYRAVYDLNDTQTFERIDREGKLPTTAAPEAKAFVEAYQDAFNAGYDNILCFTVSSGVSTTYTSACEAVKSFPGKDITVVDTQTLSMAQGLIVLSAAEAAQRGVDKENIRLLAQDIMTRTHLFVALSTLKYMAMSGRIGYLAAGIATLLDVKPLLAVRNGKLDLVERVRTLQRAWGRVIEMAVAVSAGKLIDRIAIVHVGAPEAARQIEAQLREYLPMPDEIIHAELTPGLSVHSGAGTVGIIVVTKEEE